MADVSTWSTTAANNNSAAPDGWAENQLPSTVNNCAREMMAQVATWRQKFGGWMMENVGLTATVGSGNLTVTLRVKDGSSSPSSTNKVGIGFRSSTLTTGGFDYVEATSGIDVTAPSGGTLGFASSATGYVFVYAINNAGTMELALAGQSVFDEGILHTTTAIGTGSDSSNVLYSASGRTDVAIRLIGRITIQHGAGTWSNSPTVIALWSPEMQEAPTVSGYVAGKGPYLNEDGSNTTTFDVVTNITEGSFESIGPTGSGATNEWAALDDLPIGASGVILKADASITGDNQTGTVALYGRKTGSSSTTTRTSLFSYTHRNGTAAAVDVRSFSGLFVPLDSSRKFDMTWAATGESARSISIRLQGFI